MDSDVRDKLSVVKRFWAAILLFPLIGAETRTVHGIVVDAAGVPLQDVCLDHYGAIYCNIKTDALGKFEIRTAASAFALRKPLYAPQIRKVTGDFLRVVMPSATLTAPACSQACTRGLHGLFCFPEIKGVKSTKPSTDIDYTARWYWVKAGGKKVGIKHGRGPSWTLGLPHDRDVWEAEEYSERDYATAWGGLIIDARGKRPDGSAWRYIGTVGESVSYDGLKDATARAQLDKVLDGFCVNTR